MSYVSTKQNYQNQGVEPPLQNLGGLRPSQAPPPSLAPLLNIVSI